MKIVLDTNCLLQVLPRSSPFRVFWDAWRSNKFVLAISNEIVSEYVEVLEQQTSPDVARNVANELIYATNVEWVNIYFKWNLVNNDPDDNKFVDCAVSSSADFIVTNDRHFDVLKNLSFPPLHILSLSEFVLKVLPQLM
jgi:putative PIN family toxin of toxin-antitoxin system